jgi:hypothetical protein
MIRMFVYVALMLGLALGVALLIETARLGDGQLWRVRIQGDAGQGRAGCWRCHDRRHHGGVDACCGWLFRLPSLISMSNRMRRRARGYSAVSRGLISVGTGDRAWPTALCRRRRTASRPGADDAAAEGAGGPARWRPARRPRRPSRGCSTCPETRILGLRGLLCRGAPQWQRGGARLCRGSLPHLARRALGRRGVLEYRSVPTRTGAARSRRWMRTPAAR